MDSIVIRILSLVEKSGLTDKTILQESEISKSSLTEWRKGKAKPSTDAIVKLATYFNVSTDYLLLGDCRNNDLKPDETEWLQLYSQLSLENKRELIAFVKGYLMAKGLPANTDSIHFDDAAKEA